MRFDKIYCSQGSQTSGQKHTKTAASKPKAVLLSLPMFRLEIDRPTGCSSRSRRSLIRRNKQGSLSRVPEEPAMDNSTACTESAARSAVFARVRLETNQSADCPDEPDNVRSETDRSGLVRITEGQVKTARPCSFYICLFVFASACDFISVPASVFASLLFSFFTFSFFNHFIFYSFSLIFFILTILCTMTTILYVVNKICRQYCFPLNHRHCRYFYNTD